MYVRTGRACTPLTRCNTLDFVPKSVCQGVKPLRIPAERVRTYAEKWQNFTISGCSFIGEYGILGLVQQIRSCKGVIAMKKKQFTILALVLVVVVVVAALILNRNRPYKPTSFVADGDNWSATVVDGSSIRLELNNNSKEWSIISEPETFVSDFHTITENISEFHIIALNDGEGEMVFQCTKDDGSIAQYILELSISRHQKIHLQIDSLSFKERA